MKWSAAALGFAATAVAIPQAAPDNLKPEGSAPAGCKADYDGKFEVSVFKLAGSSKRDIEKRDCSSDKSLVLTLKNSVLKDSHDRTGAIVANYQFQFDGPPQAGSLYTAGFSVCGNGSLAIGPSTVFFQCRSGDFYNLYDRHWAEQCEPVEIVAMPCSGQKANGGSPMQSPVATSMKVTTIVTALPDGQPQVQTTTVPVPMCQITQISDGQVQAHNTPCDQAPGAPVSQISDGQIQAPTNLPPISQISDGQIQAPIPTGAPVSQISDGQVQAPTSVPTGAPVTQISDGQVQAPTSVPTGAPVTQIGDGQVQTNATSTKPPVAPNAGAKAAPGLFAAVVGAALLL